MAASDLIQQHGATGVRRANTVSSTADRLRRLVDRASAAAAASSAGHGSSSGSSASSPEAPLYSNADLQRHQSMPTARDKPGVWSSQRSRATTGPLQLPEGSETMEGGGFSPYVAPGSAPSAAQTHRRTISHETGTSSSGSVSPTSPRMGEDLTGYGGAFASAAGVRRHQSLNLHRHRQQASSDRFSAFSTASALSHADEDGRPRRTSDAEERNAAPRSPLRSPIDTTSPFAVRGPWSPTADEAVRLGHSSWKESGSDEGHGSVMPGLEGSLGGLSLADNQRRQTPGSHDDSMPHDSTSWRTSISPQPTAPHRRNTPILPPLVTNFASPPKGPASASATVPWVGHNHASAPREATHVSPVQRSKASIFGQKGQTAAPGLTADNWLREKEKLAGNMRSNVLHPGAPLIPPHAAISPPPPIGSPPSSITPMMTPAQAQTAALLQQQQLHLQQLEAQLASRSAAPWQPAQPLYSPPQMPWQMNQVHPGAPGPPAPFSPPPTVTRSGPPPSAPNRPSPMDIQTFAQARGFNPPPHLVDLRPVNARFFVIKSYTEEDVHKSIKYSIWTSTALGNKRLDKAFRENAERGKVFLFFSVNSSGHFAGIAEMLTPVDETVDATVWAQSKWKGVFRVRWLYIRDVPNNALRHIRLTNTPEAKPITSSRDTQEVPYDAGLEVMRIFATYSSRTSLLQDFNFYEDQETRQQMERTVQTALTATTAAPDAANQQAVPNGHSFSSSPLPLAVRTPAA